MAKYRIKIVKEGKSTRYYPQYRSMLEWNAYNDEDSDLLDEFWPMHFTTLNDAVKYINKEAEKELERKNRKVSYYYG